MPDSGDVLQRAREAEQQAREVLKPLGPSLAGYVAFWHGRPIWTNPYIDQQAAEWRDAWRSAARCFIAAGGQSATDLKRLRPHDVPRQRVVYRRVTRRGAATRSVRARRKGIGWLDGGALKKSRSG